jgi:hypothetical protein
VSVRVRFPSQRATGAKYENSGFGRVSRVSREEFKDDLQREANQWVLKRDVHAAASSLAAIDAVDRVSHRVMARVYNLGEQPEVIPTKKVKPFKRAPFYNVNQPLTEKLKEPDRLGGFRARVPTSTTAKRQIRCVM